MTHFHGPLLSPAARALFGYETVSDPDTVECSECRTGYDVEDINAGEVRMHQVGGEHVCHDCCDVCEGDCGEYLDDEAPDHYGPVVTIRRWEVDGRLGKFHAICAVDYQLRSWAHDWKISADYLSRHDIGVIVADAFAKEVA